jgi:hypothetical protein
MFPLSRDILMFEWLASSPSPLLFTLPRQRPSWHGAFEDLVWRGQRDGSSQV